MKIDAEGMFQGTPDEMNEVQSKIAKSWAGIVFEQFTEGVEKITLQRTDDEELTEEEAQGFEHEKHWRLATMLIETGTYILSMGLCHAKLHHTEDDKSIDAEYAELENQVFKHLNETKDSMYETSIGDLEQYKSSKEI